MQVAANQTPTYHPTLELALTPVTSVEAGDFPSLHLSSMSDGECLSRPLVTSKDESPSYCQHEAQEQRLSFLHPGQALPITPSVPSHQT